MQPALTSTAYALHNLGLAAGFGGSLFGRVAFNPSVHVIKDHTERGAVVHRAWSRYNWINVAGIGATALTWLIGRSFISSPSRDKTGRALTVAKDLLLGTTVACGSASVICEQMLARQAPEGRVDIDSGNEPSPRTPDKAAGLIRTINVLGNIGLFASAGVIALTAALNLRGDRSATWRFLSKFLP